MLFESRSFKLAVRVASLVAPRSIDEPAECNRQPCPVTLAVGNERGCVRARELCSDEAGTASRVEESESEEATRRPRAEDAARQRGKALKRSQAALRTAPVWSAKSISRGRRAGDWQSWSLGRVGAFPTRARSGLLSKAARKAPQRARERAASRGVLACGLASPRSARPFPLSRTAGRAAQEAPCFGRSIAALPLALVVSEHSRHHRLHPLSSWSKVSPSEQKSGSVRKRGRRAPRSSPALARAHG